MHSIWLNRKKIRPVLQSESNECGLACIAMVYSFYNRNIDINSLRSFTGPYKTGMSIGDIIGVLKNLGIDSAAVRASEDNISKLKLPAIAHWNFNHFVIIEKILDDRVIIIDPSIGKRTVNKQDFEKSFTGIALQVKGLRRSELKTNHNTRSHLSLKGELRPFSIILFLAIIIELISVVIPIVISEFIQVVIYTETIENNVSIILFLISLCVSQVYFTYINKCSLTYLEKRLHINWSDKFVSRLLELKCEFYDARGVGDVISRVNSIEVIKNVIKTKLFLIFIKGFTSILILVVIFLISPLSGLFCVFAILLMALLKTIELERVISYENESVIHEAKHQSSLIESIKAIPSIIINDKELLRQNDWALHFSNHLNATIDLDKTMIRQQTITDMIDLLTRVSVLVFCTYQVINSMMSVMSFALIFLYRETLFNRIKACLDDTFDLLKVRTHYDRVNEVINSDRRNTEHKKSLNLIKDLVGLEVKGMNFSHENGSNRILSDTEFTVYPGESVAIVGESGCGKSTMFRVLLGFYEETSFSMFVKSSNTTFPIQPFELRKIAGVVLQEDELFSGSIAQNISFFDDTIDMDWLIECAKISCIHNDIINMKMKYNTIVGEGGSTVSSGQKQRILLARALYKRPKILLLDESTSNLNIELEGKISANIQNLKLTKIFIAHRPELINSADRVLQLQDGKLVNLTNRNLEG